MTNPINLKHENQFHKQVEKSCLLGNTWHFGGIVTH